MTKRKAEKAPARTFEILDAVRGSFIGETGRVRYDVEPGTVSEADVDPEVLAVLIASGRAREADKAPVDHVETDANAEAPAESEETA